MIGFACELPVRAIDYAWRGDTHGGRRKARMLAGGVQISLIAFAVVHLLMVLAAGPLNEMRSMVTGWFVVGRKGDAK